MKRRLIFKKKNAKVRLGAVCVQQFWMLGARIAGDAARGIPFELHYASDEEDIQVVYVEDPIARCNYAIVSGRKASKAIRLIKEQVETWSDEELFRGWDEASTGPKRIAAIPAIGVAAPWSYDAQFAKRLKEGVAASEPAVRVASLMAIGYQDWPEFDGLLRDVAKNDEDEKCRRRAAAMLEIRAKERATSGCPLIQPARVPRRYGHRY